MQSTLLPPITTSVLVGGSKSWKQICYPSITMVSIACRSTVSRVIYGLNTLY